VSDALLVLVPTHFERSILDELGGLAPLGPRAELCGLGAVAAAARGAQLLARERPRRVLLLGIAGSYELARAPLGSAHEFARVRAHGLGAGEGEHALSCAQLGFAQWPGPPPLGDELALAPLAPERAQPLLLGVCAAAGNEDEARERRARAPEALAEDMESFGLAFACALADVPLSVVRGISNAAGDRARERWRVREALAAAREYALRHAHALVTDARAS